MKSTDNDAVGGLEPSNSTATLRNRGNRDTLEAAVKGLHSGFRSLVSYLGTPVV